MFGKITALGDGVEGLFIKNERFNTTSVSYNFYLPLCGETAAANALLPFILTSCGRQVPDFSALNYKLNRLYGAQLNASAEKFGDCQLLRMTVSVINDRFTLDGEPLVSQASELLLSLIFEPSTENGAFAERDLAREKRKAIEHIRSELSEKRTYAKKRLIEEMFRGKPYGIPKCGTPEEIERITGESLYRAWQTMLSSAFVRVQVIGAAMPPRLFEEIAEKFSTVKRENITDCMHCEPAVPAAEPRTVTERMAVQQGKLAMGFSCEMSGNDDQSLPLMMMCDIFGGGPYSRLFANVREKMSLCYYCSASSVRNKGLLTVDSGVEIQNAEKAQKEILNQLAIMQRGEFSEFEMESSRKSLCDSLNGYKDSQSALDLWYALKIQNEALYTPEDIAEKLRQITREDVVRAAKGVKLHTVYQLCPKEETVC